MNDKIDISLAEDEDLARAKAWWKDNGSSIIGGIAIGTAVVIGYNFWQKYQRDHAQEVASSYQTYQNSPDDKAAFKKLVDIDSDAVYTQLAYLTQAAKETKNEQWEDAEKTLQTLLSLNVDSGIYEIAQLRLATVFLAQNKGKEALTLLNQTDYKPQTLFSARLHELKGDAQLNLGNKEQARTLYQISIDASDDIGLPSSLIQLKINNIGQ